MQLEQTCHGLRKLVSCLPHFWVQNVTFWFSRLSTAATKVVFLSFMLFKLHAKLRAGDSGIGVFEFQEGSGRTSGKEPCGLRFFELS